MYICLCLCLCDCVYVNSISTSMLEKKIGILDSTYTLIYVVICVRARTLARVCIFLCVCLCLIVTRKKSVKKINFKNKFKMSYHRKQLGFDYNFLLNDNFVGSVSVLNVNFESAQFMIILIRIIKCFRNKTIIIIIDLFYHGKQFSKIKFYFPSIFLDIH